MVYKVECKLCNKVYIRKTQNKVKERVNRHISQAKDMANWHAEGVLKTPWCSRFLEKNTIFWHKNVNSKTYLMHLEAIEYENYLEKLRLNDSHIPNMVFTLKLPIPV